MKIYYKDKVFLIFSDMLENQVIETLAISKRHSVKKQCWVADATPRVYRILANLANTSGVTIDMHYSMNEYRHQIEREDQYRAKQTDLLQKVLANTWPWPHQWLGVPFEYQKKVIMAGAAVDNLRQYWES